MELSRIEKTSILNQIIQNLSISPEEKELYTFSMEVLDGQNFDLFFEKIMADAKNTQWSIL